MYAMASRAATITMRKGMPVASPHMILTTMIREYS